MMIGLLQKRHELYVLFASLGFEDSPAAQGIVNDKIHHMHVMSINPEI